MVNAMPAHRKPISLHHLHGTYQPSRHRERASKADNTSHRRTIPPWLPENVKPAYRRLMDTLPPLDAVDETPLAQMAILKTQLQEDPDSMTSAQHGQLRQLAGMVREWVADYESAKALREKDNDGYQSKCSDKYITPEKPITYEQFQKTRSKQPEGRTKYPIPDNLPTIKRQPDTCTN